MKVFMSDKKIRIYTEFVTYKYVIRGVFTRKCV